MPTLSLVALEALRAKPARYCSQCRQVVAPNYCRQCDVYFEAGHLPISLPVSVQQEGWASEYCADHARHDSHRTY